MRIHFKYLIFYFLKNGLFSMWSGPWIVFGVLVDVKRLTVLLGFVCVSSCCHYEAANFLITTAASPIHLQTAQLLQC